jgi:predicted nucleic acid-binding protein
MAQRISAPSASRSSRVSAGLTFDTGALIALEHRRQRMARVYATAVADGLAVTVPAVVVAEWWRGRSDARELILRGVRVESTTAEVARLAGEALAAVPGATAIDAIVMASAARRGDLVYTSDFVDLESLRTYFPAVRLLAV